MKILVIGGTRYFGKRFVHRMLNQGHQVWVLSRGQTADDFQDRVVRLKADRDDRDSVQKAVGDLKFDAVVDQVCMTAQHAQDAVELFARKTPYYLMTSTMSVYDFGANLCEANYDAKNYVPNPPTDPMSTYREGKRAAENVFEKQTFFKAGFARFPIVLGEDDYTQRLAQQVQRVREGLPIYYPNLEARMSFISSEDAAGALEWMTLHQKTGAYNFAANDVLALGELIKLIEVSVGKSASLLKEPSEKHWSPFGVPQDWTLDVSKAEGEGFVAQPLSRWLPPLIEHLA